MAYFKINPHHTRDRVTKEILSTEYTVTQFQLYPSGTYHSSSVMASRNLVKFWKTEEGARNAQLKRGYIEITTNEICDLLHINRLFNDK